MKCWKSVNPFVKNQDGRHVESHSGDLGNITANENGISNFKFKTNKIQIFGNIENSIIGRCSCYS